MLIDYIRQVYAGQKFNFGKDFEITGIEDISGEVEDSEDHIELWMEVKLTFDGEIPESYRVLNSMLADWVDTHTKELNEKMHPQLIEHLKANYPESDLSGLEAKDLIWNDQVDYMPRVMDPEKKEMTIEVELVLEPEVFEGAWTEDK